MEKLSLSKIISGVVVVFGFLCLFLSCQVIPPGMTGVVFNQLSGGLHTVGQGITLVTPFVTTVRAYPTSLRTYTMVKKADEGSSNVDDSVDLPSREGSHIRQDISVTYNTSEEKAAQVFKSFKGADVEDIENTFIRRTIITIAQNKAGQMSLTELISSHRDELQSAITKELAVELTKMGFNLDKVNLGASHLPKSIEDQMQQKMAAQQNALQADYELQKQQTLAKAKVAEAEGTAQALLVNSKAQAEANRMLNETLTGLLIESKRIDKWNGSLPMITGGATPFVNIPSMSPSKEK